MQIGLSEGIKPMAKFEKFNLFVFFIKIYKFLRKELTRIVFDQNALIFILIINQSKIVKSENNEQQK